MSILSHQFDTKTSIKGVVRKTLEVADRTLIDPSNAAALIAGEFVTMDSAYKFVRATDPDLLSWAVFEDLGAGSVQASRKMAVMYIGNYEADTIVYDGSFTLGQRLQVGVANNAMSGSQARAGLVAHASTNVILARVTRLPGGNKNKLRFVTVAY